MKGFSNQNSVLPHECYAAKLQTRHFCHQIQPEKLLFLSNTFQEVDVEV